MNRSDVKEGGMRESGRLKEKRIKKIESTHISRQSFVTCHISSHAHCYGKMREGGIEEIA